MDLGELLPSQRAQWSGFFATLLVMVNLGTYGSGAAIAGAFVGGFLLFYFPVAWIYNYDFISLIRGRGGSADASGAE